MKALAALTPVWLVLGALTVADADARLADKGVSAAQPADSGKTVPWRERIEQELAKPVILDFAETPLTDVVAFIQNMTDLNIVLDQTVGDAKSVTITLKVTQMELKHALEWVLRQARLKYTLRSEALFISDADGVKGEREMRVYDVRHFMVAIEDFPGEDLNLGAGSSGQSLSLSGRSGERGESGGSQLIDRASQLVELITTLIEPDSWGRAFVAGASAEDGRSGSGATVRSRF
ncbi:MAG: hypothetical protein FJ278_13790 [Planctomycetes bacterium]|nr:hypothetical protein [Planctomycetota bacterium]